MNERNLKVFQTVCQCGSMSRAADLLDMSQPAVSETIKDLEAYYGVHLFERANRRITMSEEGKILLGYADSILSQYEEAESVLRERNSVSAVRFGVNITIGETMLSPLLSSLEQKYPETSFTVKIQDNEAICDAVLRSAVDFGITDETERNVRLDYTDLYEENMTAIISSNQAEREMDLQDLDGRKVLLREKGSGSRSLMDRVFAQHQLAPVMKAESVSDEVLVQLAEKGEGIAFLPEKYAEQAARHHEIQILKINGLKAVRHYHLIVRHSRWLSPSMQKILQSVIDFAHA